jgi:hypothetical protein
LTDNPMRPGQTAPAPQPNQCGSSSADSNLDQRRAGDNKKMVRILNMNNVVEMPYRVAHPKWIDKLISAGYLRSSERHRAGAVREALDRLRKRSKEFMEGEGQN